MTTADEQDLAEIAAGINSSYTVLQCKLSHDLEVAMGAALNYC